MHLLLEHAEATEPLETPEGRRAVNAPNLAGLAPLHFACWRGYGLAVKELVNAGAALTVSILNTRARGWGMPGVTDKACRRPACAFSKAKAMQDW